MATLEAAIPFLSSSSSPSPSSSPSSSSSSFNIFLSNNKPPPSIKLRVSHSSPFLSLNSSTALCSSCLFLNNPSRNLGLQPCSALQEVTLEQNPEETQDLNLKKKLYIFNLPWSFSVVDIKELFGQCGTVTDVEVIKQKNGRSRGFAFVTMDSGEEAEAAIDKFDSLVVGDVLSRMLSKEMDIGRLKSFMVGKDKIQISHLQFADDTLLFCEKDSANIRVIKKVLEDFEVASGLTINWHKSLVSGVNVEADELAFLAEELGCRSESLPISYLGMPLGGNPRKEVFWRPVEEKILKKVATWNNYGLSKGSPLTLIQSVLTNLPTYFMSVFKMPKGVMYRIEKCIREFLWQSKEKKNLKHVVRWKTVAQSLDCGGLGITKLDVRNSALLAKWTWRYPLEKNEIWRKIIDSIYGVDQGGWKSKTKSAFTVKCPRKVISRNGELIERFSSFKLGKGDSIRFWEDPWIDEVSLKIKFPSLYAISQNKLEVVANVWDSSSNAWNLSMMRNLND